MRRDRRQDRLRVIRDAHDDVHSGRGCLAVLLDLEPGRLAVQACTECSGSVTVGLAGLRQRLTQACPEGTEGAARNLQALYRSTTILNPASTFSISARSSLSMPCPVELEGSPGVGTTASKRLQARLSGPEYPWALATRSGPR